MQINLFREIEPTLMPTTTAATQIGVSVATIHNWVKTGYLVSTSNGLIHQDSVNSFLAQMAGNEKLKSRANKLQKDEHNHSQLSENIFQLIKSGKFNDNLWQEYENSLSESFRNKEGIYYTPTNIVSDMLKSIENVENKTFLDPCCGGGNYIMQALEKGFMPENIFGFDTDNNAIEITKKRIFEKTGHKSENIICADFLEVAKFRQRKFDYIFTNPPWGKKIEKAKKDKYATIFGAGKSSDTSSLFFFACLNLLKENGKLGFLLPEAFFNISTFEDARKKALSLSIERLIDYGKAFKGLLTKAQAIILQNTENKGNISCEENQKAYFRSAVSFKKMPKHIFNLWANAETAEVIEHVYSVSHTTLENKAKWGLGIVTGNNDKVCKSVETEGFIPIFRGQDIAPNGLKSPTLFISEDLSKCQQVAPIELYKANEKLIYRFISNRLVFFCDTKQRYILNSANMLILNDNLAITGTQLADLLNSDIMNWLFQEIFHTHKVLRGDLELLPIHIDYFVENKTFNEEKYLDYLQIEKIQNGTYRTRATPHSGNQHSYP